MELATRHRVRSLYGKGADHFHNHTLVWAGLLAVALLVMFLRSSLRVLWTARSELQASIKGLVSE